MMNPQMFQKVQNFIKNNNDPQELLNEITKQYTPEQRQEFMKFANNYGVSNEQLNKYGIK